MVKFGLSIIRVKPLFLQKKVTVPIHPYLPKVWGESAKFGVNRDSIYINPNIFVGFVGKVRKKLSPEGGRKGGWRKKRVQRARQARGSNPGPAAC